MSLSLLVWFLTLLCALAVVGTRVAFARSDSARVVASTLTAHAHTVVGLLSLVGWVLFLAFPEDSFLGGSLFGILVIGGWWVTAALGLKLFSRWLPSSGRHSGSAPQSVEPRALALSAVTHLGLAACVVTFTWAYVIAAV